MKVQPPSQWQPSKAQIIGALTILLALFGALIAAGGSLGLSDSTLAWFGVASTVGTTLLRLLSNQALDEALETPPPKKRQQGEEQVAVPDPPEGTQSYG